MKSLLFVAALSLSGNALAQDSSMSQPKATAPQPEATGPQPSGVTTTDGTVPGDGVTQQGTDPNGTAVAPPGTNEAFAPPPGTVAVPPTANQTAAFTPQAATTDYPPCSKTVTDRCIQTYERGVRNSRRK